MKIIKSNPLSPPAEPAEGEIKIAILWSGDGGTLIECTGDDESATATEHFNPEDGTSTAFVMAGSYTAIVKADAARAEFRETVKAGGFNHDDRPEWPDGAMVRYEAEAGTQWWCFNQPWIPASRTRNIVYRAGHTVRVAPGAHLLVIRGVTSWGEGTYLVRAEEEAETVELESGRGWLMERK